MVQLWETQRQVVLSFRMLMIRLIFVASSHVGRASIPVTEAVALRDGLVKAKEKGFIRVEVEEDSKLVIEAMKGEIDPP
ncbi:hypothetical protein ACLB2K_004591 [Fragaria x ananassa]